MFKLDTTGKETVLYSFTGKPTDGADPMAGLVLDAAGNLYGTTAAGSDLCYIIASLPPTPATDIYCGTVFKLDTSGTEMVLHSFTGSPDGAIPGRWFDSGRGRQPLWHHVPGRRGRLLCSR